MTTYGVLGVGSIAAAIVNGLCVQDAPDVLLSPRSAGTAHALAARYATVTVAADNQAVLDGSDVVIVAVLPGQAEAVLTALDFADRHVVISVVAGVGLEDLRSWTGTTVARAVPLPAVAGRDGRTPVYPPAPEAVALFDLLGGAIAVDDAATYEALTASSATVAAHFAYLGAIADWLVSKGLSPEDARGYVGATFVGASESLRGTPDFGELITEVATPGGLNEQFARDLGAPPVAAALDGVLARLTVAQN
ncbi:NAD(P)-binding domain-containing protein [Nocardioides sp. SR21]|uniref:NAD(P)-binding domain-containing protein n=1 Tax=Nocardioides sp. SR21 TaxID=2919501 RepID=UPI001FA9E2A3|nr:NAD(P)-binding domain-containing protein [Nocardioides sp. SR21]